jgi:Uma2 family endonuclease
MTDSPKHGKREATYEDVLRAPPDKVAEVLAGELVLTPRPRLEHSSVAVCLNGDLDPYNRKPGGPRGPGGWWNLVEPELHLQRDIIVPDLCGWRRERMPNAPRGAYAELAPDWACEILSPSTAGRDRVVKMAIYAREQLGHIWLADPAARAIDVFRLEAGKWLMVQNAYGNSTVRLEPFGEVELDLSRWWGETPDP